EVAPNVRQAQESRHPIPFGERDLAAILTQFRRNKSEAELVINPFFGRASDPALARKQTVFIELPVALDRKPTKHDIMRLRSGEIDERSAITLFRHDAHIDL